MQLAVTAAASAMFIMNETIRGFVFSNPWTLFVSMFGALGVLIAMAISPELSRTYPKNYICLAVFTAFEAVVVGAISASYQTDIVLMAAGITCGVVLALTVYALQTKYDFTTLGGLLISLLFTLIIGGLMMSFLPQSKVASGLYATLGALLFSCYLVFDVQLMTAGKKVQISPDDYVFAAINIYLDILNIFLHILRILNEMQR